jgi:hypothetical protein
MVQKAALAEGERVHAAEAELIRRAESKVADAAADAAIAKANKAEKFAVAVVAAATAAVAEALLVKEVADIAEATRQTTSATAKTAAQHPALAVATATAKAAKLAVAKATATKEAAEAAAGKTTAATEKAAKAAAAVAKAAVAVTGDGKRVIFPASELSTVLYCRKCAPHELAELFYTREEEMRFQVDYDREAQQAEVAGLDWNKWVTQHTEEDQYYMWDDMW